MVDLGFKMKKGQFSFLSKLILVAVSSLILLMFSTQLFSIIGSFSKDSGCKASAIANSVGNTVSMGMDVVKLDCPTKHVKILNRKSVFDNDEDVIVKDVTKTFTLAEKNRLDKVNYFPDGTSDVDENTREVFRLNQAVADEMKACWDNLGQGKLNLFSSWFQYVGREAEDENWFRRTFPHTLDAPTVCVICSKIDIDDELYEKLSSELNDLSSDEFENARSKPNSLIYWLTHNAVPKTSLSYYEYLLDDVNEEEFAAQARNFEYSNEGFSVVFARKNNHMIAGAAEGIMDTISSLFGDVDSDDNKATSAIYLLPYTKEELEKHSSVIAH